MPHKRAKASVRAASSSARGFDLPPTAAEAVPSTSKRKRSSVSAGPSNKKKEDKYGGLSKNVWRIVNAEKLRDEHRDRQQKRKDEAAPEGALGRADEEVQEREGLRIRPGEKLADFNRRVETTMRQEMAAVHKAARRARKSVKKPPPTPARAADDDDEVNEPARPEKTFAPRPTSFGLHLHDVAMEPPSLSLANKKKRDLPVSMAQRRVLEEERTKAVKRYRELKEARLALQTK